MNFVSDKNLLYYRVAIVILVFFSFFLVTEGLSKVYLPTFNDLLPRKRVTKIGPISMDILKKVCLAIVIEDVIAMRVTHVTPCALRYSR